MDEANPSNPDLETLQSRFEQYGDFDIDDPPPEALDELVTHVQLDDEEVALLFGDEYGLSWAELRDMPRRVWRQTAQRVRTAVCDGARPQAWASAAGGAGVTGLTAKVLVILALPPAGGIAILVGVVTAAICAKGLDQYCAMPANK